MLQKAESLALLVCITSTIYTQFFTDFSKSTLTLARISFTNDHFAIFRKLKCYQSIRESLILFSNYFQGKIKTICFNTFSEDSEERKKIKIHIRAIKSILTPTPLFSLLKSRHSKNKLSFIND